MRLALSQRNYLDKVVRGLEEGLPLLIENLGMSLDAVLGNMVARAFIRKGDKSYRLATLLPTPLLTSALTPPYLRPNSALTPPYLRPNSAVPPP